MLTLHWSSLYADCTFDVIAHRGASFSAPENTLAAIRAAVRVGAPYIEADVRLSSDGIPVLIHDSDVDRTTNGSGPVSSFTAASLARLDAGSWRSPEFSNEPVPTLERAVLTAHPHARLYLDIKDSKTHDAVAKLLLSEVIPRESVILAVSTDEQLSTYARTLPDVEFAWFGAIPNDWDDPWFERLLARNVFAIEAYWPTLYKTHNSKQFITVAKRKGLRVWTYLLNDKPSFEQAIQHGVDGIETDFPGLLRATACGIPSSEAPLTKRVAGQWNFDAGDFTGIRSPKLVRRNIDDTAIKFGSSRELQVPTFVDGDGPIVRIDGLNPSQSVAMYPDMRHVGLGNGEHINRFTLIMDILRTSESDGRWQSILQTDYYNRSDADLFINPQNQIGVGDVYHGHLEINRWHRLVLVVDLVSSPLGELRKYIDGVYVGKNELNGLDDRWAIYSSLSSYGTLLFSDNDNETAPVYLGSVQIRNYVMSEKEIASLGTASAKGITRQIEQ